MTKRRRYIIDTALFHYIYLFVTPDKISGDVIMISGEMTQFWATWLVPWNVAATSKTDNHATHPPKKSFYLYHLLKFKLLDALDMSVNGKRMRQTFRNYFKIY